MAILNTNEKFSLHVWFVLKMLFHSVVLANKSTGYFSVDCGENYGYLDVRQFTELFFWLSVNETTFWLEWQGTSNHRVINVDRREIIYICAITFRIQIQKAYRWPVRADCMFFLRFIYVDSKGYLSLLHYFPGFFFFFILFYSFIRIYFSLYSKCLVCTFKEPVSLWTIPAQKFWRLVTDITNELLTTSIAFIGFSVISGDQINEHCMYLLVFVDFFFLLIFYHCLHLLSSNLGICCTITNGYFY